MRFDRIDWPPPPDHIERIARFLMPAIEATETDTLESVLNRIAAGEAQLWVGMGDVAHVALVTRIRPSRDGPVLEYWLLGGEHVGRWFGAMVTAVEAFAARSNCVKLVSEARPGWRRLAKDYRVTALCLEKRL